MNQPSGIKLINWFWTATVFRWILLAIWTLLLALSLAWNVILHSRTIEDQARIIARTAFEKDVLYRRWNNGYGGVYVWLTPDLQPNPYLKDIVERDLTTTTGRQLTMINPAYMTRQVFELQQKDMGVIGHITSLMPVQPANAADAWETQALQSFERGEKESSMLAVIDGQPYVRLMRPLMVEEKCLRCHASQGYVVGQVRGGISETVPLTPLQKAGQNSLIAIVIAHASIWLVGVLGILWSTRMLHHSLNKQQMAEQKLLEMSTHDRLTGLFNRAYFEEMFQQLEEVKTGPITILMADVDKLKRTNDELGHAAGDELLRRAGQIFHQCFRASDLVARIGGDEFVVILPNTSEEQSAQITKRFYQILASHNELHKSVPLEISIGTATSQPGDTMQVVFKLADARMYEAKKKHKDQMWPEHGRG